MFLKIHQEMAELQQLCCEKSENRLVPPLKNMGIKISLEQADDETKPYILFRSSFLRASVRISYLQRGQVLLATSHGSTHLLWNLCWHCSTLNLSNNLYSSKHTAHLSWLLLLFFFFLLRHKCTCRGICFNVCSVICCNVTC